jgi:hypothetical protein
VPKPEISAPGGFVAAAMSADADPRQNPGGLFDAPGCPADAPNCYVADSYHAVTAGTSMSAPHVAGAIALLLQMSPNLTQAELTDILQAGARYPQGKVPYGVQLGAGELDLMGALAALPLMDGTSGQPPAIDKSWYVLSSAYARPDPTWPVWGTVELRREDGSVASGLDGKLLELHVEGGVITQPLTKVRHGLFRFAVAGQKGATGNVLKVEVTYDGASLGTNELPIGPDVWSARGELGAVGGCSASIAGAPLGALGAGAAPLIAAAGALSAALRRRARRRKAEGERG